MYHFYLTATCLAKIMLLLPITSIKSWILKIQLQVLFKGIIMEPIFSCFLLVTCSSGHSGSVTLSGHHWPFQGILQLGKPTIDFCYSISTDQSTESCRFSDSQQLVHRSAKWWVPERRLQAAQCCASPPDAYSLLTICVLTSSGMGWALLSPTQNVICSLMFVHKQLQKKKGYLRVSIY